MTLQLQDYDQNGYQPNEQLLAAINTSLLLKRPLLLSGKPGTGKTECADFVAAELNRRYPELFKIPRALRFNTKSVSQFTDLFYQYDAVGHFGNQGKISKERFFFLAPLGLAIAGTNPRSQQLLDIRNYQDSLLWEPMPCGSVVLIDEIDKAPRDFPNDLLAELEKTPLKFDIRELNDLPVVQSEQFPVVVIVTSNNEKGLPEAFLRRCIFHYIEPPTKTQLISILKGKQLYKHLSPEETEQLPLAIDTFITLREMPLYKQPSTSELIDWIACLHYHQLLTKNALAWSNASADYKVKLKKTLFVLAKTQADLDRIAKDLGV